MSVRRPILAAVAVAALTATPASAEWTQDLPMGQGKATYAFPAGLPGPAVRLTVGAGISEIGPTSRIAMEATQWVRPNIAVVGRFAAGPDFATFDTEDPTRVRTDFQMGALYRVKELGATSVVAGAGLGLDIHMWEADAPEEGTVARAALRMPPIPGHEPWNEGTLCTMYNCIPADIEDFVRTNAALSAGILSRSNGHERSLLVRGELVGLTGYAVTLNVGFGAVTYEPPSP